MTKSIFLLFAAVCCALFCWAGGNLVFRGMTTDIYEGKLLLEEADYRDFKSQLVDADVSINSITTVTSEPAFVEFSTTVTSEPAFVEFSVTVPEDYPFTFGEKADQFADWWTPLVALLVAAFFVGFYFWWPDDNTERS